MIISQSDGSPSARIYNILVTPTSHSPCFDDIRHGSAPTDTKLNQTNCNTCVNLLSFLIVSGFLVEMALLLLLWFWRPQPDHFPWFCVISGFWGLTDSIWRTQLQGQRSAIKYVHMFLSVYKSTHFIRK